MRKTDIWQRIWHEDGTSGLYIPARAILYVASFIYRLIISLRNWFYNYNFFKEIRLPCPVISVGNITVGGTGKTPCVIWLARMLQEQGFKPAILSRGYGGTSKKPANVISNGRNIVSSSLESGDEPYLIALSLKSIPVITGPKRILTGKTAIDELGANILICDDAFQHRQIFRNINLVLLDCKKPLGNGHLLPRGELREPVSALKRADVIILTRAGEVNKPNLIIQKITDEKNIPVFTSSHKPVNIILGDYSRQLPLSELKNKKVCAFAGIARPESFKKVIEEAGAQIVSFENFSDHHNYNYVELNHIYNNYLKTKADLLITTEKDAMRLHEFQEFLNKIYILQIEMEIIPDGNSLKKFILEKLQAKQDTIL
ncbi:MAG: tetraacyldisaccharide 4'-kinase [Smithella sp.]